MKMSAGFRLWASISLLGITGSCTSVEPTRQAYPPAASSNPTCRSGNASELVEAIVAYRNCAFTTATAPNLRSSLSRYTDNMMAAAAVLATCRREDEAVDAALLDCSLGDAEEAATRSSDIYLHLLKQTEQVIEGERASPSGP